MKKSLLNISIIIVLIALLAYAYYEYGDVLVNRSHEIDQEAEHSMTGVDRIVISNLYADIKLNTADYDDFYATFTGLVKSPSKEDIPQLEAFQEDETLYLEVEYDTVDYSAMKDMSFSVYIPANYHGDIEILSSDGNITIPSLELSSFICITSNGNITSKSLDARAILLSSINGSIKTLLTLPKDTPVTIDSSAGSITCEYPTMPDTDYKFLTTTGDILIGAVD